MAALSTGQLAGPEVALEALLSAREARAATRARLVRETRRPVVTVTVVMPGPVKDCRLSRVVFAAAGEAVSDLFQAHGWLCRIVRSAQPVTGPEALIEVAADARLLKAALVEIEESHSLGRLFDLDVTAGDGEAISRSDLLLAPRRCLICDRPAKECGRSRAHSVDELLSHMEATVDDWLCCPV
jgi:holo-ACP synthase